MQQRREQRQHQRLGVVAQVRRGLHRRPGPPGRDHPRGDVAEQPVGQVDRADRAQLADLGEHRVQADVARHRLDQRQHRVLTSVVVRHIDGDQGAQPAGDDGGQPSGDPGGQRLLGLVQRGPHDPVDPPGGRRFDPLGAAPRQQLAADQLRAALRLAHVAGQPLGQRVRVGHRALPEAQVLTDLRPVVLDRAASPLVKTHVTRLHADLAGHILDSLVRHLATTPWEPAHLGEELQQHREAKPRRPALASDQLSLVIQQCPVLDELIEIQRPGHGQTSWPRVPGTNSPRPQRDTTQDHSGLHLVTRFLPEPLLPAQTRHPPPPRVGRQPGLVGGDPGAATAQKLGDLATAAHPPSLTSRRRRRAAAGGPAGTCLRRARYRASVTTAR